MECVQCSSHAFIKDYDDSTKDESSTDSRKSFEEYYITNYASKNVNNNVVTTEPDQIMKMECGDTEVITIGKQNLVQCSCLDQFSRKSKNKTKMIKKSVKSQIPQILNRNMRNRAMDEKPKVKSRCDFEICQQKSDKEFNERDDHLCGDIETHHFNRSEMEVNDIPIKASSGHLNKTSINCNARDGCTTQNDQLISAINKQHHSRMDLRKECPNKCPDALNKVSHHNSRGDDEGLPNLGLNGEMESKKNNQYHRNDCNQNFTNKISLNYASESGMSTVEEDTSEEDRLSSHSTTSYKSEYEIKEYQYNKWISKESKSPVRTVPQINRSSSTDFQRDCQRGPPLLVERHKSNCYLYKMLCDEADNEKHHKPVSNEGKSQFAKSNESLNEGETDLCHACIQTNSSQTDPCDKELQDKHIQKICKSKHSISKKNDGFFYSKQENHTLKETTHESQQSVPSRNVLVDEATYIIKSSETLKNGDEIKETRQKPGRTDLKKQFTNERNKLTENKQNAQTQGNERYKTKSPHNSHLNDEKCLRHRSKEHHLNETKVPERPREEQHITVNQITKDLVRENAKAVEAKCVDELLSKNQATEHKHYTQNLAAKELMDSHNKEKLKERISEGRCGSHEKVKSQQTSKTREFYQSVCQHPLCEGVDEITNQQRINRQSYVNKVTQNRTMEVYGGENLKQISGNRTVNRQTSPQHLSFVQRVIRQKSLEDSNCRLHNSCHQPMTSSKPSKLQGATKEDYNVLSKTKEVKVSKKDSVVSHGQRILSDSRPSVSLIKKTKGENARQHKKAIHQSHECFTSTFGDQGQQRKPSSIVRNLSRNRGCDTDNYAIKAMKRMGLNWNE